jgi:integrase
VAREKAAEARALLGAGGDPLAERAAAEAERRARATRAAEAITFRAAATAFLAAHEAGWRNAKHRRQWGATLATYAFPAFGDLPVGEVALAHVLAAVEPIWRTKPETASRLRGRIESILDFATVRGWRAGDNPARWKGNLAALLPAKAKVRPVAHHAAMRWQDVPGFVADLAGRESVAALALRFLILTAARTGEVLGARWDEIDGDVWTVPASRMKAGREHRVPLSPAALAIVARMAAVRTGDVIFPGQRAGQPLSAMAATMLLRRMGQGAVTAHGFRSAFRDWAGEATAHPREVIEHALAHRLKDKAEAAYARGDLFEKRRRLMADWATFLAQRPADVLPMDRPRHRHSVS